LPFLLFTLLEKVYEARCWWFIPVILDTWEAEIRRLRPALANSLQDPIPKITRAKWTGGVAQVI
jgi:hypothetical protein